MSFELLYGTYDSTFDEKGRVLIPAALRERYKGQVVVTQGSQQCVWIMLPAVWKKFQNKLEKSEDRIDPEQYELLQYLHVLPARVSEIDKTAGRLQIAPAVRTYAGLINKKCLVMSAENRLEVWDSQYYYDYINGNRGVIREATNKIGSRFFKFDENEDKV